ncbi:GNAT family N-acetyltransferase [Jiangella asiatica]|uniref:GNAT family N-acetyltransferase n=1 Tax=Jiangella asiatica TaxID=2530372 RepID=A0A4R5CN07_9ACTN|nr:GNAT family N-acetyltransferase [Jiangella asiatica]TDD98932.1 GNAT family N-acetyltransferase [Jiangella asiatica]
MTPAQLPLVEPLSAADDLADAARLYREVFGYQDPAHSANPRLLASLVANGGSVVGARGPDGALVAFAYGFVGVDGGEVYHYSQAAVVDARYQGIGLGRALKRGQRAVALAGGQTRMRWSYDPAVVRNAHFNLDVLGAVGRWFRPDFFGPGTDRVIVDWDLDDERRAREAPAPAVLPPDLPDPAGWLRPRHSGLDAWLPLPLAAGSDADGGRRAELGRAIAELIGSGHVATSCVRLSESTAAYRFMRVRP